MIPKILYHGTTKSRWQLGIKQRGLKANMPTHLEFDKQHMGYTYFAENLQDACYYALLTFAMDNNTQNAKRFNSVLPFGIVIAIRTSNLKGIEKDPEWDLLKQDYIKDGEWEMAQKISMRGMWYRYKGDIPTKYIMPLVDVPVFKQYPQIMQALQGGADYRMAEEYFMKNLNQTLESKNVPTK